MSQTSILSLLLFLIFSTALIATTNGRKLLTEQPQQQQQQQQQQDSELNKAAKEPSLDDKRMYLTSLPKGKVPASTPSKKGHSVTIDQKLIARHLGAVDRILRSVPSPGIGH